MSEARFHEAAFGGCTVANIDLGAAQGIGHAYHLSPSTIGTSTLELTGALLAQRTEAQQDEVFAFLRKAGVHDELITTMRRWVVNPIEFYSCFISYSHADQGFARRLYDSLQGRGIRCWLDEHQVLPGDNIYDAVDRGVRLWDKLLLCCSEAALTSWWVGKELGTAFEKEREFSARRGSKVEIVIPLNLDGYMFSWTDGKATSLRERYAPSFLGWETDANIFNEQVGRVIASLRSDAGAREEPPPPKV